MRQLREENRELKQVVADLTLDKQILQEAMSRKLVKPAAKRAMAAWAEKAYNKPERHICRLFRGGPFGSVPDPLRPISWDSGRQATCPWRFRPPVERT